MKRLLLVAILTTAMSSAAAPPPLDAKTKQLVFDIYKLSDNRAHGRDERVRVDSFYDSVQFLYVLTKRLAS